MILLTVTLAANPGKQEAMMALMQRTMLGSQAEPGCVEYRFTADLDDPLRFHLIELWEDQAAFDNHLRGDALRGFIRDIADCGQLLSSTSRAGPLEPYSFSRPGAIA